MLLARDIDPRARRFEQPRGRVGRLRQQRVAEALQKERDRAPAGVGHRDRLLRAPPLNPTPRAAPGNRRQPPPAVALRQRQTAQQRRAQRRKPHAKSEPTRPRPEPQHGPLPERPMRAAAAQLENLLRQRNFNRANLRARAAGNAEALRPRRMLRSVVKRRVDQPNRARIDVPEGVPADHLIRRADIGASAAANAAQRLGDLRIRRHLAPPVVEQDDVHLLARLRARNAGRVRAQLLRRRRARQQLQLPLRVRPGRDQLFDPRSHKVDARQRGRQPRVALVGHQHHAARLRDQRVRAGQSRPGAEKVIAQTAPRARHHRRNVVRIKLAPQLLAQQRRDPLAPLVNRRHHQVTRTLPRQLQQPLPQIRLNRPNALRFELVIELDLLRDHRLALHHQRNAPLAANVADVIQRILRRLQLDHSRPRRLRPLAKLRDVVVDPLQHAILGPRKIAPQLVEANPRAPLKPPHLLIARNAPRALKVQQPPPQMRIPRRPPIALLEAAHGESPITIAAVSRDGPCTPMVSERSMSAVRDGPVTNVA